MIAKGTTTEAIEYAPEAARLTTTLNRLRAAGACTSRYEHLLRSLGGTKADHDAPINLLYILKVNGVEDAIWALRATAENCDVMARLFACDCAEAALPIFERQRPGDNRPRAAIEAARRFARGEISADELDAASAARDAAWTAWAAAEAAARAAASAARAAAWTAASAAQQQMLRRYLLP